MKNKKVSVAVKGMHCVNCAANITKKLSKTKGVANANVNFATEKASVEFDDSLINDDKIIEAIEKAGYKARDNT
jgi:P-type Cu+ transporter